MNTETKKFGRLSKIMASQDEECTYGSQEEFVPNSQTCDEENTSSAENSLEETSNYDRDETEEGTDYADLEDGVDDNEIMRTPDRKKWVHKRSKHHGNKPRKKRKKGKKRKKYKKTAKK